MTTEGVGVGMGYGGVWQGGEGWSKEGGGKGYDKGTTPEVLNVMFSLILPSSGRH